MNSSHQPETYADETCSAMQLKVCAFFNLETSSGSQRYSLSNHILDVLQVLKRLPNLKKLDGIPVDVDERDAAAAKRNA